MSDRTLLGLISMFCLFIAAAMEYLRKRHQYKDIRKNSVRSNTDMYLTPPSDRATAYRELMLVHEAGCMPEFVQVRHLL